MRAAVSAVRPPAPGARSGHRLRLWCKGNLFGKKPCQTSISKKKSSRFHYRWFPAALREWSCLGCLTELGDGGAETLVGQIANLRRIGNPPALRQRASPCC